jgi:hypothetical protein
MDLEVYIADLQKNIAVFKNDVVYQAKAQMLADGGTFDSERDERNHQHQTARLKRIGDQVEQAQHFKQHESLLGEVFAASGFRLGPSSLDWALISIEPNRRNGAKNKVSHEIFPRRLYLHS